MNDEFATTVDSKNTIFRSLDTEVGGLRYEPRKYPQVIKYMGSKAAILGFIGSELAKVHADGRPFVDLFAGACAISGGFGHMTKVISNDIQEYSAVISSVYLRRAERIGNFDIIGIAANIVKANLSLLPHAVKYPAEATLEKFNEVERANRGLLNKEFDHSHHLFTRVYSGTWWSAEQCVWIDAIREVLDDLFTRKQIAKADFDFGLTCLLHAMAYTSQGTGHYAQYRDAKNATGMADINKYRSASLPSIYQRKFDALLAWNLQNVIDHGHEMVSMDFRDCLSKLEPSVVYADPPYAFVHYSRFYHAMETIVKYDYPEIQHIGNKIVKGRYRVDRHQSPFCIKTKVKQAFIDLFDGVRTSHSDLLLSYSNTGMIDINELIKLAECTFGNEYDIWFDHMSHTHMTMGRREDRSRNVRESLIMARKK